MLEYNEIKVQYKYQCPTSNYLDGKNYEVIDEIYVGPDRLYLVVDQKTGEFETVLLESQARDGRPVPKGFVYKILDCKEYPLVAEVLSDYHANFKDDPEYLETPGSKTIPTPDGFEEFEYEYPIHPDVLYDDKKSVWNFETEEVKLYKNKNIDIIGEAPTWEEIREMRNAMLFYTDAQAIALERTNPEKAAQLEEYRQKLRDVPQKLGLLDPIFVDSSFPKTDIIEL